MEWYIAVLKKYAVFDGRARRKEFWMFVLVNFLIGVAIGVVEGVISAAADTQFNLLSSLYSLAVLLPTIGVAIRRLHDTGRSGWWYLLVFIPIIGWILLIVWYAQEGQHGPNQYGPDPKGGEVAYAAGPAYGGGPEPYAGGTAPHAPGPAPFTPVETSVNAPAAWLQDPTGRHEFRYWDGQKWTDNVSDAGVTATDPV